MAGSAGVMLCGISQSWQSNFLAEIIGLAGIGGNRRSARVASNLDAGGWSRTIFSCIRTGKPFRATIVFKPSQDWITPLGAAAATWTITWAIEPGYSAAATLSWSVGMTDYTAGGQLEDLMLAEVELTPSGAPTITPGT